MLLTFHPGRANPSFYLFKSQQVPTEVKGRKCFPSSIRLRQMFIYIYIFPTIIPIMQLLGQYTIFDIKILTRKASN